MKSLEGWVPIRVYWRETRLMVDWCRLSGARFTAPFFDQAINQALSHPATLLFRYQTPIENLGELASEHPGIPPSGFIFHMSRCGSTLISQMLAAVPGNIVISEAGPIDTILRSHFRHGRISDSERVRWLQWMVSVLGRRRHPFEERLFVKFDCWHTCFLPLIEKAFPGVPLVFVYRKPVEVMVSQAAHRGAQMLPGVLEPELFGWDAPTVGTMALDEYGARVIARICEAALDRVPTGKVRLINYQQLPGIVSPALMQFWKLNCTPEETGQMFEAARFDAKNPVLPFADDSAAKAQAAPREILDLAERWLDPSYHQLETQRKAIGFT